jgi:hypothetical protein
MNFLFLASWTLVLHSYAGSLATIPNSLRRSALRSRIITMFQRRRGSSRMLTAPNVQSPGAPVERPWRALSS